VDFIVKHPNIAPGSRSTPQRSDPAAACRLSRTTRCTAEDLWLYKLFGKKSTSSRLSEHLDLPRLQVPPEGDHLRAFDWLYEHQGSFFWTVEICAPVKEAGVESYKFIDGTGTILRRTT
jgi:hypothetical protein